MLQPTIDRRPFPKDMVKTQRPQPVYVTNVVAYDMRRPIVSHFLDLWCEETMRGSTQDQVSFSYVIWRTRLVPFAPPETGAINGGISGTFKLSPWHRQHTHGN